MAFYNDAPKLEQRALQPLERDKRVYWDDWVGMRPASLVAAVRWRANHRFHIPVYCHVAIRDATFNLADCTATVEYTGAVPGGALAVSCDLRPMEVIHNSPRVAVQTDRGATMLPVISDSNRVMIRYQRG